MAHESGLSGIPVSSTSTTALAIVFAFALLFPSAATSQTYQVIHHFTGGDGEHPSAGLTMDAAGRLYGTTYEGGSHGWGTVFRLTHAGSGWVLNTLYNFQNGSDGYGPAARVIFGPDGALYGTTVGGGSPGCEGCGTVFKLQPPPAVCKTSLCPWNLTTLHAFAGTGQDNDGRGPVGDLIFDRAGNLYGATTYGGQYDDGTVYELSPGNGGWTESVIHSFEIFFRYPQAGVSLGSDGNLYGTAFNVYGYYGGVYRLVPSGGGWTEQDLYSFQLNDGGLPYAGVIFDNVGNLYGANTYYGADNGGTAFELSPSNGGWSFSLLTSFVGNNGGPAADLAFDQDGNLYGTTIADGVNQFGNVFKLTAGANGWSYSSLYDFTGVCDGGNPASNVIFDASGNLYGTARTGCTPYYCDNGGCGVVWEITP